MEIKINKCPYCGSSTFQVGSFCRGTFNRTLYFSGEEEVSSYGDGMSYGKEKTPICSECMKPLGRWIKL